MKNLLIIGGICVLVIGSYFMIFGNVNSPSSGAGGYNSHQNQTANQGQYKNVDAHTRAS